jgi:malonyl-CoA/methylmalonyl-CoA synthetase
VQSLYRSFRPAWRSEQLFLTAPDIGAWSYADLEQVTGDIALLLRGAGLQQGNRLVTLLERSPWNIFLYLACARAGIVYVPLNPRLTVTEFAPIVADADPALVLCDPAIFDIVRGALPSIMVRTFDVLGKGSLRDVTLAEGSPDADLADDAAAAIIFTSGTTGRPKGALMPHALFVGKARALSGVLGYTARDCLLHTLPLYHAHGLFMTLHCVLDAGASILLLPRFDAAEVVRQLPQATVFSGVPTMYKRLSEDSGLHQAAAGMRLFISGSAALPREVFTAFEQRSGHSILECWGMSETMTNTANPLKGERRPGSCGQPLPGVTLRVVAADGKPVPTGTTGVLEVGFTAAFGGYWRRPASEQPRIHDGHMVTGDIGWLDDEGYLTIVGRTSEVIISGGYNVYPREVEIALEELPEIARAAVFALPHPDLGEAVAAAVEPAPGATVEPAELLHKLRASLVGYKLPRAIFPEQTLPMTELGKVQRNILTKRYAAHFRERF